MKKEIKKIVITENKNKKKALIKYDNGVDKLVYNKEVFKNIIKFLKQENKQSLNELIDNDLVLLLNSDEFKLYCADYKEIEYISILKEVESKSYKILKMAEELITLIKKSKTSIDKNQLNHLYKYRNNLELELKGNKSINKMEYFNKKLLNIICLNYNKYESISYSDMDSTPVDDYVDYIAIEKTDVHGEIKKFYKSKNKNV